jgi:hypothetical protein
MRSPNLDAGEALRGLTVAAFGVLCLVVLGVGAVALLAESQRTWEWYFRMEQVIAAGTPVVVALLGVVTLGAVVVVYLAD